VEVFSISEDTTVPSGGVKAKNRAMDVLRVVLRELELDLEEGEVGTHSICKCASTHVRGNGVSKDDKDTRGHWKATGRVSDQYNSVQLPFVDTKVASVLCIGGACTYVLKENAVPPEFVLQEVVPEINKSDQFDSNVSLVLGTALLWACFNSSVSHLVPLLIKDRVMSAYGALPSPLQDGVNPVEWRLIIVSGDNKNVSLTPVSREEATAMDARGGMSGAASRDLLLSIALQLWDTNAHVEELRLQYERDQNQDRAAVERHYCVHNENIRRMAIAPARRIVGGVAGSG
jgi:hypothetical protein